MKILLTSTSFQDSKGLHQEKLCNANFEVDTLRGPLKEADLIKVIKKYDGIICGDDEITDNVIKRGNDGSLKIISKYGVGLDKIDLISAKKHGILVTNCEGTNHITVSEHVFGLILCFLKNIHWQFNSVKEGSWSRKIGTEIYNKKIGIIGLGKIGKEVALKAKAFGLEIFAFDPNPDLSFINKEKIRLLDNINNIVEKVDILTLHVPLIKSTKHLIDKKVFSNCKRDIIIVNTSRALIINQDDLINSLKNNLIGGYLTDVLENEPINLNEPLLDFENVLISPHVGSRTYESIERQGLKAVENLLNGLEMNYEK